jgi:molybdopterin-guanine dinucleotide biosynthesis protein A
MIRSPGSDPQRLPLAAILAGGASRRFGSDKALAEVDGRPLIERVRDALLAAVPDPVLITADPERFLWLGLASRPDAAPGGGPLAGIHAALLWSRERGRRGALVVACDLPFLHPELLRRLAWRALEGGGAAAVAPEGPDGRMEPLCAWYSEDALPEVEARLRRGDLALRRLLPSLGAERIPRREIEGLAPPEVLFHNVNSPADRDGAERMARAAAEPNARD